MKQRRFESPDRALVFLVVEEDGDVTLGFEGYAWHTHPDSLRFENFAGATTVEGFLEALLQDRLIIAISRVEGTARDVWITDDPAKEQLWLGGGEALEFRFWSGKPWPRP